jgi:hypothetical protein
LIARQCLGLNPHRHESAPHPKDEPSKNPDNNNSDSDTEEKGPWKRIEKEKKKNNTARGERDEI